MNPDLKWLEPESGLDNFSICVYLRLMKGLKKSIVNNKKRKRHILENMLYMVELNPKNVMLYRLMMGGSRWEVVKESEDGFNLEEVVDYKLNLYEGDYLKFDSKIAFGIDKFDVIVMDVINHGYQEKKIKIINIPVFILLIRKVS